MIDARILRFETLGYAWDPSNPLTGEHATIKDLADAVGESSVTA
jgi:adenylyltransferase/sulfurtransferase